jgi:hypothetical protein
MPVIHLMLLKEDRKVPFQGLPLWQIYPLPHFLSQQSPERIIFQLTRGEKRGEQLNNRRASFPMTILHLISK